jgi:hypothetical protein
MHCAFWGPLSYSSSVFGCYFEREWVSGVPEQAERRRGRRRSNKRTLSKYVANSECLPLSIEDRGQSQSLTFEHCHFHSHSVQNA